MDNLLLQSEYAEIMVELLQEPYSIDSVIKLVFMSFCVRNETRFSYKNRKTDFVDFFLDNLNIRLLSHPDELGCIFAVLNKLKTCGWIKTDSVRIDVIKDLSDFKCEHKFLNNCKAKDINPIIEVNKLDDKAFLEEVLRHV